MKATTERLHTRIASMQRGHKRLIMVVADMIALPFALWSGYVMRFGEWWPAEHIDPFWWMFFITPVVGVFIFARLGLYRAVVRFMGVQALMAVVKGACLLALLMWAGMYFYGLHSFPRSVPVNFALVTMIYVGGTRLLIYSYYQWLIKHYTEKEPVIIYGAGGAGVQLSLALSNGREFYPVAFLDDDKSMWNSVVQGLKVYSPERVEALLNEYNVSYILLAMPNSSKQERKRILDLLEGYPIHVQTVPSMPEIVSGEASVDQLREIELEDLLGRDPVPPLDELLDSSIKDKVVLVTGAGGSIGSELCRQIVLAEPKTLLLIDNAEFSLYNIEQELQQQILSQGLEITLVALLASVCDRPRIKNIMQFYQVNTVYHAAAYKHVPIVEHNVLEGVRNNIFGSQVVAESALESQVERCVLISTDKAVRPTNVMGATKRFAELILQDLAERSTSTIFSMVRFGNVLGSSGSVVPLFRQQIQSGGPVTVTHADITRFFMTIPEASLLVIQAGSLAKGGDVFVLDMGEPVKIVQLARRMIQLSGYDVRDDEHPDGDIEISYSGLRPGEKLYEELLIGDNVTGTIHPKIMRAEEERLTRTMIETFVNQLRQACDDLDAEKARSILEVAVSGFKPVSQIVDHLQPHLVQSIGRNHITH